ncbi:RutC family protein [compost metagenome]
MQVEQTIRNLSCLLKSANATLSNVVKVTLYVKNLENFSSINQVYANYFKEPFPARTCVEVTRLPLDVGIEIDAIAYVPNM